jgi:hypothetical protein
MLMADLLCDKAATTTAMLREKLKTCTVEYITNNFDVESIWSWGRNWLTPQGRVLEKLVVLWNPKVCYFGNKASHFHWPEPDQFSLHPSILFHWDLF